jgi:hypothetical protein
MIDHLLGAVERKVDHVPPAYLSRHPAVRRFSIVCPVGFLQ